MTEQEKTFLVSQAWEAAEYSYSPYSDFMVGAALLSKTGMVYTGCNIENVAFSPTNCAERTAFFKAISEGEKEFSAIAVVGKKRDGEWDKRNFASPCGVCRQVMLEFCDQDEFLVILGNQELEHKTFTLGELIPQSFISF